MDHLKDPILSSVCALACTCACIFACTCKCTARTGVLPGEVRVDCAGLVFSAFWDVGGMAEWLTRLFPKHDTLKMLNPKNLNLT